MAPNCFPDASCPCGWPRPSRPRGSELSLEPCGCQPTDPLSTGQCPGRAGAQACCQAHSGTSALEPDSPATLRSSSQLLSARAPSQRSVREPVYRRGLLSLSFCFFLFLKWYQSLENIAELLELSRILPHPGSKVPCSRGKKGNIEAPCQHCRRKTLKS